MDDAVKTGDVFMHRTFIAVIVEVTHDNVYYHYMNYYNRNSSVTCGISKENVLSYRKRSTWYSLGYVRAN